MFQYPPTAALVSLDEKNIWKVSEYDKSESSQRKIGLYIHIPYCTGTCSFCYFARYPRHQSPMSINEYLFLLKKELSLYLSHSNMKHNLITSISLGGGTPTCLDKVHLMEIFSFIRNYLNIPKGIEISVESSPETISGNHRHKLELLQKLQVNRLSIGIQTFENDLLKQCNRRHNAAIAEEAVSNAYQAGFNNINIDVIYGLPKQTYHHWEHTLNIISSLSPESVSLYRLRVHPRGSLCKIKKNEFPQEIQNLLMYIMAVEHLQNAGYLHVSSHNFVRAEKYIQKHVVEKQGLDEFELLGIGLSAYSYLNYYHYWNYCSFNEYRNLLQSNHLPVWIGTRLSIEERQRKAMVLGMHEYKGVNISRFRKRFQQSPNDLFGPILKKLIKLQLLSNNNDNIFPTYTGMIFADELCTQFYSKNVQKKIRFQNVHPYGVNYIGRAELQKKKNGSIF